MDLQSVNPIVWTPQQPLSPAEASALSGVAAGILRPHARPHALHVFLQFTEPGPARSWIRTLAPRLSSTLEQLQAAERRHRGGQTPEPITRILALSAAGYRALGLELPPEAKSDVPFAQGMAVRSTAVADPPVEEWEAPYQQSLHALLILASEDPDEPASELQRLFGRRVVDGVQVVHLEPGAQLRNDAGDAIEHFGYVDGRSLPRFFSHDRDEDQARNETNVWRPELRLSSVLVEGVGPDGQPVYGSFLVYRKLDQNVRAFKCQEESLGAGLGLVGEDAERAGAIVVGRFEDGRPLEMGPSCPLLPVQNGFDYATSPCPALPHIRVVNPRGSQAPPQLARRGMPYGHRVVPPGAETRDEDLPDGGVGLLFMACTSNLEAGFEGLQKSANNKDAFLGFDAIIGQGAVPEQQWTDPLTGATTAMAVGGHVTMLGGEYFFLPSLISLGAL